MRYRISAESAIRPGVLAAAGDGDVIVVEDSGVARGDWGGFGPAILAAITRGASVQRVRGEDAESA